MENSSFRVLVVEDYEPFRRFICSTLKKGPDLRVVGEASEGLEAVQKAEKLQPDLIVLDIGLPTLNGIEAARRIRKLSPETKILFVSQESSAAVVQEALRLGARGYVVKAHAGSELLAAVKAVCQGRQFFSREIPSRDCTSATDAQIPDPVTRKKASPSLASGKGDIDRSHSVQFYSDDASFVIGFARFIDAALKAGNAVIVVVTESRRVSLLQGLQVGGVDVAAAVEQKHYIPLDVADKLTTFMVDGLLDPLRFAKVVGDPIVEAAKAANRGHPRIAAY